LSTDSGRPRRNGDSAAHLLPSQAGRRPAIGPTARYLVPPLDFARFGLQPVASPANTSVVTARDSHETNRFTFETGIKAAARSA
jgi:hypothetical protein